MRSSTVCWRLTLSLEAAALFPALLQGSQAPSGQLLTPVGGLQLPAHWAPFGACTSQQQGSTAKQH